MRHLLFVAYALLVCAIPAYAALLPAPLPSVPYEGCVIQVAYEDGSKIATCGTGVSYAFDPDGNDPPASVPYDGPRWEAGWYRCKDYYCTTVDYSMPVPDTVMP